MFHRPSVWLVSVGLMVGAGCVADLDTTRDASVRGTFGETLYQESCQRVAYTAQLDEQAAGLRATVDVTGTVYGASCQAGTAPPDDAPQKLKALYGQRPLLVRAVDQILPANFLASVETFLEAIVVLSDDGTMEEVIDKTAALLGTLKDDAGFTGALGHFSGRSGYRTAASADLVRALVGYPALDDFVAKSTGLFLDKDDKATPEFAALLDATSHELRGAQPLAAPGDQTRTLRLALNLLFTPGADFGGNHPLLLTARDYRGMALVAPGGDGKLPAPFVDNNGDGLADIDDHGRFLGANAKPLTLGTPLPELGDGATRDMAGRLLDAQGNPVFGYLDLDQTFFAGALRELPPLLDPQKDNLLGLLFGASSLLGPRVAKVRTYPNPMGGQLTLDYSGFATDDSALLDLLHAFLQILGDPNVADVLTITRTLLTTYEDPATRTVAALFDTNDRGKVHPEATIPATSDLYDDLMPIIARVLRAQPRQVQGAPYTLTEDLMDALEDPHVKGLAPMMARLFVNKDRFQLNQNDQTVVGGFNTPVDYGSPDSDWNRSVMQRLMHLVNDAGNAQFCNKDGATATVLGIQVGNFAKCDMFRIDDLGLFFALTIADKSITDDKSRPETRNMASFREHITNGTLHGLIQDNGGLLGDQLIASLTGIDGFTRFPTPAAAARSLFLDHDHQSDFMKNSTDPVLCVDGDRFVDVHNDTLFAWEATLPNNPSGFADDSFYDAVRPLINAFARHDECIARADDGSCTQVRNAAKIFLDLLGVLHKHWGSAKSSYFGHVYQSQFPNMPRFSSGDGAVTYERLVGEVLSQGDLVPALLGLVPTLNRMTIDGTNGTAPARPTVEASMAYLLDPNAAPPGLAYRNGKTDTLKSDGVNPGPRVTPYYLLADAYSRRRAALAAAPPAQAGAWLQATSALVDQALTVATVNGAHQMKNRRMHGMTLALIDYLHGRLAVHEALGDRQAWIHTGLIGDIATTVDNPVLAALVDLTAKLEGDDGARNALYGLLNYLTNESVSEPAFLSSLSVIADQFQLFLDDPDLVPIARAAGVATDPGNGAVEVQLKLLKRSRTLDPSCPKAGGKGTCTLVTVLRNLFGGTPGGHTPASDLGDALSEVNRSAPGGGGDFNPADYRAVLDNIQQFLTDEQRGFIRFVQIVKNRRLPNAE